MVNTSSKKRSRTESTSSEESENEYQVEEIVDKRTKGKRVQYFLKWKGYDSTENTWEDEGNLNCPDLVKQFEESIKKKTGKNETKPKRKTTGKQKKAKLDHDVLQEQQTDDNQVIEIDDHSETTKEDDHEQNAETSNLDEKAEFISSNEETSPNNVSKQTRLRSTSKSESIGGDSVGEIRTISDDKIEIEIEIEKKTEEKMLSSNQDDDDIEETTSKSLHDNENNLEPSDHVRLRINPESESSITFTLNDSDNNNNNTNEKSLINHSNINNDDEEMMQSMNEDQEPVERIEAAKHDHNGILFRIQLIGEKDAKWVPAKIANRKYPQSVIAFWESHVEFT